MTTKNINAIGLATDHAKTTSEKLSLLLAGYSVFYQNLRGFHWHIKGREFFELHEKFEELYNNVSVKVDEIAERILTLGFEPEHRFAEYLKISEIKETGKESDGIEAVKNVLESFKILLILQREILDLAGENGDEGTNAMMSDYITEQEKLVWMYAAFLG